MSRPGMPAAPAWLAVAVGGLVGSELRYGLGLAFPDVPDGVPWATLGINVCGSFLLAALTTFWLNRPHTPFWLRAGLGPGLLGSFTTFSAVIFAVDRLAQSGAHVVWAAYLALSLVLGLAAAGAGWQLGKVASPTRNEQP
ncbi:camphor resistance protein CrcB [Arthrobacter sp. ZBG10]|uniref:fluoride efflux transporter FluC n=1 Tax=unclassified Arthrobacter TaxID=235627 RepID=UPI000681E1CF|nr:MULTISPECIES: CrcB family protein [unclassified Arthrobacter]KNH17160.1 camphor resistance protein CrcB [Arthrobacter sp. ZBG10]KQR03347.1 camphor resistance protein CrcB [Arthrobacter sp. Leaf141]